MAKLFGLDDETWLQHANPRSVYSRFTLFPLFVVSAWSRVWIDEYFLVPLALTIVWTFLNPRLFERPESLDSWASKGVLGERIWKDRDAHDIDPICARQIHALNLLQVLGLPPFVWGLYTLDFWMTMTGLSVMFLAKTWFFDRMVWLLEERRDTAQVREWLD